MRQPLEIIEELRLPKVHGVLQIGANAGQEIPYFLEHGIAYGAFVEPLDEPFSNLCARCAGATGYLPIKALCGSVDMQLVDFHVASNHGGSSSILKPANHLTDYPWVQFISTEKMHTFTLDRIYNSIASTRPEIAEAIDLLFMDVQGAELEVVKGGNSVLNRVRYIYTEVGIGGGYEGDVELIVLMQYLRTYGFKLYELEIGATGWGNAFFIKRDDR